MVTFTCDTIEETMNVGKVHIPVMPQTILEYLNLSDEACFVDCTLGCAGHAELVAEQLGERGRIIGIDRDKESLQVARQALEQYVTAKDLVHDDFRHIDKVLDGLQVDQVDGILLDLGISSFQLNNPERGFSLKQEGPLDMRMDQDSFISAYDLINSLSEREIALILKNYGEERFYNRIARTLVAHRPIQSTSELSDIVLKAMPIRNQRQKIHPATRTFQAFRIAVNRELEALEVALDKAIPYLKDGGRIAVISFHSLEDRIVKNKFRNLAKSGLLRLITKKPLQPEEEEIQKNPRARSARLRVAEKIDK